MRVIWKQQKGYIVIILLNVTGKLPAGIVDVYARLNSIAAKLDIPVLIVGATARDIILVHGFGAAIERGTRDVDFGIEVQSWAHYQALSCSIIVLLSPVFRDFLLAIG